MVLAGRLVSTRDYFTGPLRDAFNRAPAHEEDRSKRVAIQRCQETPETRAHSIGEDLLDAVIWSACGHTHHRNGSKSKMLQPMLISRGRYSICTDAATGPPGSPFSVYV